MASKLKTRWRRFDPIAGLESFVWMFQAMVNGKWENYSGLHTEAQKRAFDSEALALEAAHYYRNRTKAQLAHAGAEFMRTPGARL